MEGDWKLMVDGEDLRLFNLADDPGELTDVHLRFPDTTARLGMLAARITAENMVYRDAIQVLSESRTERGADTEEIKKTLRSLGYVR